jgi:cell division protease FtsH
MSEEIGLAVYEARPSQFLGSPFARLEQAPFSEKTAEAIDTGIKQILDKALRMAETTLAKNTQFIEAGAKRLLEIETLDEDEVAKLWAEYGKASEETPLRTAS